MISSANNNVSALNAFSRQVHTTANNLANAFSDDFKARKTYNTQAPESQTVTTHTAIDTSAGPLIDDPVKNDGSLKELSNTDMAEELTNQISAQNGFDANAKVIQTHDQTLGTIIDMMG